jgi:OmpA-OmpF porin, OOP family
VMAAFITMAPQLATAEDGDDSMGWLVPGGTPARNFYAGVGVGVDDIDYPDTNQDGSVSSISDDDTDQFGSAFLGYQINDYVAVQGGYYDFGDSDFSGVSDGSGDSWTPGNVSANLDADGWELGVLGRWPIAPRWYALGFIGWLWWDTNETFIENGFVSESHDSGSDLSYALGLEYDIGRPDRILYRFMLSQHEVDEDELDVNGASAEIVYRFP